MVADTGPLLHLHQVKAVEPLDHLGIVQATPIVLSELRRHAPDFFQPELPRYAAASGRLTQAAGSQILSDLEHDSTLWMSAKVRATARKGLAQIFGAS